MSHRKLSRRDFLRVSALAAAGVTLAACGAGTPDATEEPQEPSPDEAAPVVEQVGISFMGWGGTEEDEGVRAAIEVFQDETPDVTVDWIHTPENYTDKLLSMVAAGTPPDTAFVGSGDFQPFACDGLLLDITGWLEADPDLGKPDYFIEPQEKERCTVNGRWYGIGSCWVAPHIYYNADIFDEAGIEGPSADPEEVWDWPTFLDIATQLTVDTGGKHPGEAGFDPDNIDRWGVHWPTWSIPLSAVISSNEGRFLNPDTGLLGLDQPEAIEAVQKVADLVLKDQVSPHAGAFEQLGMSNTQMLETGKLAIAIDGSWALAWMCKIEATLGCASLPKLKVPATDMQAHLHSGFKDSTEPEAAWKWLRFLATEYYQLLFLEMGLWLPSQRDLMTEAGRQKWMTLLTAPGEGVHPEGYEKIVTEFVPKYGVVLYQPPGFPEASSIINPAFDAIWVGDMTAEEALTAAVPEANAILEKETCDVAG